MGKGGYKIIDLKNVELNDDAVTIDGIYEAIEGNYKKALLLTGLCIDGVEYAGAFTTASVDDGNYIMMVYGYTITITDDDEVTAEVLESEE